MLLVNINLRRCKQQLGRKYTKLAQTDTATRLLPLYRFLLPILRLIMNSFRQRYTASYNNDNIISFYFVKIDIEVLFTIIGS